MHRATLEKYGDSWTDKSHFVGNGAYKIADRTINEKIILERNPIYWNNKETVINKVGFIILNENAGISRFRTGTLDQAYIPEHLFKDPKFRKQYQSQIFNTRKLSTFTYAMNMTKAPFNDIRVRKALNLSLDRKIITDKVLGFSQTPTSTFTPFYINGGEKIQQPDYANLPMAQRNEEAIKLLTEAGYSKGHPLKAELLYNTNDGLKSIAVAVSAIWKKNTNGLVDIHLKNMEWKTFLDEKRKGNFDLAFDSWGADYNEATTFLSCYLSDNPQNSVGFNSKKFDDLIAQSYKVKTNEERQDIYAQAEAELDSYYPFVAIYHYAGLFIKNPKLKGYEGKSPQGVYYLKDLYLTDN